MTVGRFIERIQMKLGRRVRVGIVGFGRTGRALYRALLPLPTEISIRCREKCSLPVGVDGMCGDGYLDGIFEDVLILSPSVRRDLPPLLSAKRRGVILSSDCEIFLTGDCNEISPEIYAVSGSDGKTTVTSMVARILDCPAIGNIGIPFSESYGATRYAVELSSFNTCFFAPVSEACAITCVTPNHLDWHRDFTEYLEAKRNAIKNARRAVLCYDDGGSFALRRGGEVLFSLTATRDELLRAGASHAIYSRGGVIYCDGDRILSQDELSLCERHNVLNFMAALGLTLGRVDTAKIREVGRSFAPPKHRCEHVHTDARGVRYVDSSIDTTPSRTAVTLAGLGRRVSILLGGRGKGLPLLPLVEPLSKYAERIAIYGELGRELADFLDGDARLAGIPKLICEGFDEAVKWLSRSAREGGTVLLSPAATAYGEFLNYEKRGERFCELVRGHP